MKELEISELEIVKERKTQKISEQDTTIQAKLDIPK